LEAKKLFDQGVVFIDVRNPRYYEKAHIPGAYHMDFKNDFYESKLDGVAKKG
jgi:rhodanese-related sulfurtransferase